MRILIISDAWQPQVNGVVRTLTMLERELREQGHVAEVIGPDRFRTIACPTYPEIRLSLFPAARLRRMIVAFDPDALHIATEGPLGLAAARWARRNGFPFTTAFHTRFPDYIKARTGLPATPFYRWLRRFHATGEGMMVATESLRRELSERGFNRLLPWSRGVDLDIFHPGADTEDVFVDLPRPVFLYVGRVAVEKNIEAFLSADLPGSKVVVGEGPHAALLKRQWPSAHYLGARHGAVLAACFAGADVKVFPSLTDTFGLVTLEALASGTPVAAFPVTGPGDLLRDAGEVGVLAEDLTPQALGQAAMQALNADRAQCRRFAEQFSWAQCARVFVSNLRPVWGLQQKTGRYHAVEER
ncbi:Glycosyltransferase [Granulibacter bethesdensis]|uniref:glycosyltransferase family 4 protein n=1 Tax=Granulibacter bethesdensis TaxID=364410 RepID=UPI00090A4FF1|nr:glycosyltransferase family 1 protein [Granulibacter bethesdensis]APH58082.1 Glycosyltransferase [Granulibacter bethesdensis]